jgi:hypothetical protein
MEKPLIGLDVQVAIIRDNWVRPLYHPGCDYGYIGDGKISYLVSERFIDFKDNSRSSHDKFEEKFRKLKLDWKDILKKQEELSAQRFKTTCGTDSKRSVED